MDSQYSRIYRRLFFNYEFQERRFSPIPSDLYYQDFREMYNVPYDYFYNVFNDIERKLLGSVIYSIDSKINEIKAKNIIREDTAYFLVVNYHHMVIVPFIYRNFPMISRSQERFLEIGENIRTDINLIFDTALQQNDNPNREISSHTIIRIIDGLWKELRMMKLEIWG